MSLDSREVGLNRIPVADRPPVQIPFFAFRIMVGVRSADASPWRGSAPAWVASGRLRTAALVFCGRPSVSFPLGFIATLTGWFTAEVGRQPWTVFGQLRPWTQQRRFWTTPQVATTLVIFAAVYALIFLFGAVYIYRLLRRGPTALPPYAKAATNPKRPLSIAGDSPGVSSARYLPEPENDHLLTCALGSRCCCM